MEAEVRELLKFNRQLHRDPVSNTNKDEDQHTKVVP